MALVLFAALLGALLGSGRLYVYCASMRVVNTVGCCDGHEARARTPAHGVEQAGCCETHRLPTVGASTQGSTTELPEATYRELVAMFSPLPELRGSALGRAHRTLGEPRAGPPPTRERLRVFLL